MKDYGRFQPQTRQRIRQLEGHLQSFAPAYKTRIQDALQVMLYAHQGQDGRRPGEDYAQHPLEVALHVIEEFGATTPEIIIAALLHDTVEDQPARLLALDKQTQLASSPLPQQALQTLAARFGPRVAELVSLLTNPDFASLLAQHRAAGRAANKYQLYQQHFLGIFEQDAEAFMIKMADFAQNALQLHEVPEGPRKAHFRRKYGPLILLVIERLNSLTDPAHPLFARRAALIKQLNAVYQRDYAPYMTG